MFKNYIKIAWRNLFKHKGYTFINIFGLAVGIAVCVLIFKFVSHELSYDTFHEKSERTYRVTMHMEDYSLAITPSMASPTMQEEFPEVETGVRLYHAGRFSPVVVRHENTAFEERSFGYADSTFFEVFDFELLSGNPETALAQPNTMVISRDIAAKYFGNENPVGKSLIINNDQTFEVTGVMENMPDNSHFQLDFVASLITRSSWSQLVDDELQGAQFFTYVVLNEANQDKVLEQKVNNYVQENYQRAQVRDVSLGLQPLTDIHLYSDLESEIQPQSDIQYVWAASAIALLILIIACINYMNLATARSSQRSQEVGVRKVLGSDRGSLVAQFYGESAFLTFIAIIFSVLLIELFNPWFNQLVGQQIDVAAASPFIIGLLLSIGLIVTLLAGSYPALLLSSFSPSSVLKGKSQTNGNSSLRKGLVVFQFAVSVVLIIGTLTIYQQVNYVQQKELGYQKENVLVMTSYDEVEDRFDTFKSLLMQNPGINNATMASETPTNIQGGYTINVDGIENSDRNVITGLLADHNFTETLGIDLVAGRSFTETDYKIANQGELEDRTFNFLINESMAQYLGEKPGDLLGRQTVVNGRRGSIVGVIEDFHFAPLHKRIGPLVVFPQAGFNKLLVSFNTDDTRQSLQETQKAWQKLFPNYPFEYQFLDQEYDALYQQETRAGQTFSGFAILAIFIACLGLLGLSAYMVERRTKEIGIRKVLGASVSQLVFLLSKDFTKLVLISIAIAIPAGWWLMNSWLQDFAYRINLGIWEFVIAGATALLIAWLTVSWQAIKAAMMNPVNSLQTE